MAFEKRHGAGPPRIRPKASGAAVLGAGSCQRDHLKTTTAPGPGRSGLLFEPPGSPWQRRRGSGLAIVEQLLENGQGGTSPGPGLTQASDHVGEDCRVGVGEQARRVPPSPDPGLPRWSAGGSSRSGDGPRPGPGPRPGRRGSSRRWRSSGPLSFSKASAVARRASRSGSTAAATGSLYRGFGRAGHPRERAASARISLDGMP